MTAPVTRINGFRPVKHLNGSPYNGQFNIYEIVAGDATAAFIGDLVKPDAGVGTVDAIMGTGGIYQTCIVHAAGQITAGNTTPTIGCIVGFVPDPTTLNSANFRAASTKRYAMVADAPDLVFEVQDGGTVPCTSTLIGNNVGITAAVGSTTTGVSAFTTGTTAPTTTNTLPLKIVGIVNRPDNDTATAGAAFQKLLVTINQHQYMGGTTAI